MGLGLICSLIGHRYRDTQSDTLEEVDNRNNQVSVQKQAKVCVRCGDETTQKELTRVVNSETETGESATQRSNHTTDQQGQTVGDTVQDITEATTEEVTAEEVTAEEVTAEEVTAEEVTAAEATTTKPDGAEAVSETKLSLESDSGGGETEDAQTENVDEESSETGQDGSSVDRDSSELLLEDNRKVSDTPITRVVSCTECEFRIRTSETARRDGDYCPECSSWIEVREEEGIESY